MPSWSTSPGSRSNGTCLSPGCSGSCTRSPRTWSSSPSRSAAPCCERSATRRTTVAAPDGCSSSASRCWSWSGGRAGPRRSCSSSTTRSGSTRPPPRCWASSVDGCAAEPAALVLASREQAVPDALQDLPGLRLGPLAPTSPDASSPTRHPPARDRRSSTSSTSRAETRSPCASSPGSRLGARGSARPPETPLTERLERVFGTGSAALPSATRTLLLVMARRRRRRPRGRAGGRDGGVLGSTGRRTTLLGPAGRPGSSPGAGPAFAHPLVRSALVRTAAPEDLRRVHRAGPTTWRRRDPDRSAWHRAAAGRRSRRGRRQRRWRSRPTTPQQRGRVRDRGPLAAAGRRDVGRGRARSCAAAPARRAGVPARALRRRAGGVGLAPVRRR